MTDALEIAGKKLLPIKDVVGEVSYSRDYITRLAREGKVRATHVGRQWFVDLESLTHYAELADAEQEIRKKQLSESRKQERLVREAVKKQNTLQLKRAHTLNIRAVAATAAVMFVGFMIGVTGYQVSPDLQSTPAQVASATQNTPVTNSVSELPGELGPSRSVSALGEVSNGILLLPKSTSTYTTEKMFSDDVVLHRRNDGTQVVLQLDASGQEIGDPIPFVQVPVVESEI